MIRSGGNVLVFSWNGNQLDTHMAPVPDTHTDTIMTLPCRDQCFLAIDGVHDEKSPTPSSDISSAASATSTIDVPKLKEFMARCLLFTRNLHELTLIINNDIIFRTNKSRSAATEVVPPSVMKSRRGYFSIDRYTSSNQSISVEELSPASIHAIAGAREAKSDIKGSWARSELSMRHIGVRATVKVDESFQQAVTRVLKKRLPASTTFQLLYAMPPKPSPTDPAVIAAHRSLQGLLPINEAKREKEEGFGVGRVFIGLGTSQSTGTGFHTHAQYVFHLSAISRSVNNLGDMC
jgi:hypothetical protein